MTTRKECGPRIIWTDENIEELRRRFADGETDASIAGALRGTSAAVQVQRCKMGLVREAASAVAATRRRHLDAVREARKRDAARSPDIDRWRKLSNITRPSVSHDFQDPRLATFINQGLEAGLPDIVANYRARLHAALGHCESPIEKLMGAALYFEFCMDHDVSRFHPGGFTVEQAISMLPSWADTFVFPQCWIGSSRVDFLVAATSASQPICYAIECDGHDFHQKTRPQVDRDNRRDLALDKLGVRTLRFSGSAIVSNPRYCAEGVAEAILAAHQRMAG